MGIVIYWKRIKAEKSQSKSRNLIQTNGFYMTFDRKTSNSDIQFFFWHSYRKITRTELETIQGRSKSNQHHLQKAAERGQNVPQPL